MWSLDGTATKVGGPILTPDLNAVDGTLTPSPETEYALAVNGVTLQAPVVDRRKDAVLYRVDGNPLQLKEALVGRESDGWMIGSSDDPVARASYTRYDVSGDGPGLAVVKLSRLGWCPRPGRRGTGKATVKIGPVGIGPDKQPRIERVTETRTFDVHDCEANGATLSPPNVPWRMEITVAPTFSAARNRPVEERPPPTGCRDRRGRVPAPLRRLARRRDEVGEPRAQREPRKRAAALERFGRSKYPARQRDGLRHEEGPQLDSCEACGAQVRKHVVDAVLTRIEVEDELQIRVVGHAAKERASVTSVVDGAEHGRCRDRLGGA